MTFGSPDTGKEVDERAVAERAREPQHLAPQRRDVDRRWGIGRGFELEPARPTLAREHGAQRLDRLAHLRERLLERDLVPALDDHARRGADAEAEAPPLASWSAAACWASTAGPRVKALMTPVPSRISFVQAAARISGVNPSGPFVSPLQRSS